jgi:hypothetical protein
MLSRYLVRNLEHLQMSEAIYKPGLRLLHIQSVKCLNEPVTNVEAFNDISLKSIRDANGKLSASQPM